jgi:hypothetical protein
MLVKGVGSHVGPQRLACRYMQCMYTCLYAQAGTKQDLFRISAISYQGCVYLCSKDSL